MSLESRIEQQIREKAKKDAAYREKFQRQLDELERKQNKTDTEIQAIEIVKKALAELS